MERSIRRRRKMQPAGMIQQAKFSFPIRDRSSLLRHCARTKIEVRSIMPGVYHQAERFPCRKSRLRYPERSDVW